MPPYFLTFRACFTRFSITPSKASLSPIFSSVRFCQYSSTSFAVSCIASTLPTCALSSSSVIPSSASSVVVHTCSAATRSNAGSAGGPFRLLDALPAPAPASVPPPGPAAAAAPAAAVPAAAAVDLPCESTDVLDAFVPSRRSRESERRAPSADDEDTRREPDELAGRSEGRTSFFCLEAGRISSRSTGTPSETRKSRRMRDRIQSGGWSGGGATSCDQREALRGVRKTGLSPLGADGTVGVGSSSSSGKSASR